jgi:hypothetical protein
MRRDEAPRGAWANPRVREGFAEANLTLDTLIGAIVGSGLFIFVGGPILRRLLGQGEERR